MEQIYRFSAPGRTEISGNHTDHQRGCVLAAAVDLETSAEVTLSDENVITVDSEGYSTIRIPLDDLGVHADERNTTASLIRGIASAFRQRGGRLSGFHAKVWSTVLPGSGLSSSAAFEVLIGTIINDLSVILNVHVQAQPLLHLQMRGFALQYRSMKHLV